MPPLQWQIVKLDGTNLPTCDQICGRLYWIAAASFHLLLISKLLSHLWAVFWSTFKPCMCLFYFPLSLHMDWAERLCREILRFGFTLPVAGLNNFPKSDKENLLCVPISSQGCLDQFPLWSILLPKKRREALQLSCHFIDLKGKSEVKHSSTWARRREPWSRQPRSCPK